MNILILLPAVLAMGFGLHIFHLKSDEIKKITKVSLIYTVVISISVILVMTLLYDQSVYLFSFNDVLSLHFKIDELSLVFSLLVSFLWPAAVIYASQYMTHEEKHRKFFAFYIFTFGVVYAFSIAANMLTLYLLYEVLSFITYPLVIHGGKPKDIYAGKNYIAYSVTGAAISFVGMMIFMFYTNTWEFNTGAVSYLAHDNMLLISYVFMFVGFAVKAGLFPFHRWLIAAGVAPTPVTALLHAVAVVKAGVFATMRVTYYLFEPSYLQGTFAQVIVMSLAIVTIIFGSSMAVKNKYMKRRFAYSTVSQLSYILLAVTTMSTFGLEAAMLHLIFHALVKIVIFYTAGNAYYVSHHSYVSEIEGYGLKMKTTFICFTICSLSLIGIPPLGGFSSKFAIAQSAIQAGDLLGFLGVCALMISALLTAIYLLQIVVLAFVPHDDFEYSRIKDVQEAPKAMSLVLVLITIVVIVLSLNVSTLADLLHQLFSGGI